MHFIDGFFVQPHGQGALQFGELALALVLSSLIGLEREFKLKSAGLRTHALVGVAAALITLVSKYGFTDILSRSEVVLDPSRVAAQIVSGIGFIGGGLIFVQRNVVRGLTTAAIIWLTAAVGMACGAGLPLLALFVTAAHFLVIYGYTPLTKRILYGQAELRVHYLPGKGVVQEIMQTCTGRGFTVYEVAVPRADPGSSSGSGSAETRAIELHLRGRGGMETLVVSIGDIKGVISARATPMEHAKE